MSYLCQGVVGQRVENWIAVQDKETKTILGMSYHNMKSGLQREKTLQLKG